MKKVLIIGSTVTDVIIRVNHLPKTEEDINAHSQKLSLGGCAYNVSHILSNLKVPYSLFSPIGTGTYGDFVRKCLAEKNVNPIIPSVSEENGCCYCFVEDDGKRTFISVRGAEYHFKKEWFENLDASQYDCAYVCGLELEEPSGDNIIDFLKQHPAIKVFFAPGPRLAHIPQNRMNDLFSLNPILHLNKEEACSYTCKSTIDEAVLSLTKLTNNSVIITDAANGSYLYDQGILTEIPPFPATQIDSIGAGDAHIGTIIACLQKGYTLRKSIITANCISAAVVETPGALLPPDFFNKIILP